MGVRREVSSRKDWSRDEDFTLEESLDILSPQNYRKLLPGRSMCAIRQRIKVLDFGDTRLTSNGLAYTTVEAAAILGVLRRQVVGWIELGIISGATRLPSLWQGRQERYLIPWSSIDDTLSTYPMLFPPNGIPDVQARAGVNHRWVLSEAHPERWINTMQAARLLGRQTPWTRKLARLGRIPARMVLGEWYFLRDDVMQYIQDQQRDNRCHAA